MDVSRLLASWPALRQLREGDPFGLGKAVQSPRSKGLVPRIDEAEHVVQSVCPYCAVGCGQLVYVKDGDVAHIEGDPASPISRGRLCPKGAASRQLVTGPSREYRVKYRRPYGREWEELDLDRAMDMIADRVIDTRRRTWQELSLEDAMEMIAERIIKTRADSWEWKTEDGNPANRTMAIGNLGGATLDNEENYLIKKLMTALGIVQVENQARI